VPSGYFTNKNMNQTKQTDFSVHLAADIRDHWWTNDFIDYFSRKHALHPRQSALDIGCGAGHSTHLLAKLCGADTKIVGVDNNADILETARQRSVKFPNLSFQEGSVTQLPFADNTFDVVFCQTLLIHVHDLSGALAEMKRVLKPGGVAVMAEMNNASLLERGNSALRMLTHDENISMNSLFNYVVEGKKTVQEGDITIAPMLPSLVLEAGFESVSAQRNDQILMLHPPYQSAEQQANLAFLTALTEGNYLLFSPQDCEKYYFVTQTDKEAFQQGMDVITKLNKIYLQQIAEQSFVGSFGAEMIITVAHKAD
jgi:ubiquinone/menaquinone biosynthesis C-methylase UbiE